MQKNLQVDNYQVDFNEFETSLHENLGLKNFNSNWWPKGWCKHYCSTSLEPAFQGQQRSVKIQILRCIWTIPNTIKKQKEQNYARFCTLFHNGISQILDNQKFMVAF